MSISGGRARRTGLCAALVLVAMLCTGWAATAAHASGVEVFVGYADNFRASPTHFPTPWDGSPGVTFDGCTPGSSCTFDGGAVRFLNNTGAKAKIEEITVSVSTCEFKLWSPHEIEPGEQLIVAQTTSGASNGCISDGTMDTSDIGPNGEEYAGNCTPDGIKPVVSAKINGTPASFTDEGQVINTGGFDLAECPPGTNESSNWVTAGKPACGESSLTLEPPTQTHTVGTEATVTAKFACEDGEPLSGATVSFEVLSGPNAGTTGTGTTNSEGEATFKYTSTKTGTDEVQASVETAVGPITSNTVLVNWTGSFPAPGGAFVIGDKESGLGTNVTFWGAKWSSLNPLSAGTATPSFKGFALNPSTPTCGDTWSTDPGNSTPPPAGPLPEFMLVIVTSSTTKSGSTISGKVAHIVVVKTNSGYAPNPGHPGTGTVVGQVC